MQVPTVLINGGDTNLASYGDACVDNDCEHAVELLADRHTFVNGPSAGASYLVLESFFERDSDGSAIWTISDVIAIADLPIDNPVTLLAEGCTLVNLPEGITAVATLRDWNSDPVTPTRVWGLADTTGALVEVSVDPAWTCEWQGD